MKREPGQHKNVLMKNVIVLRHEHISRRQGADIAVFTIQWFMARARFAFTSLICARVCFMMETIVSLSGSILMQIGGSLGPSGVVRRHGHISQSISFLGAK